MSSEDYFNHCSQTDVRIYVADGRFCAVIRGRPHLYKFAKDVFFNRFMNGMLDACEEFICSAICGEGFGKLHEKPSEIGCEETAALKFVDCVVTLSKRFTNF